ncbi:hypothetical protein Q3O60_15545 [Alkalimonas collagenimarina]|uniref:Peptidase MA-like domain-containing protein n=1 Tax=Alkalimonas collagenimarina TaxID=400390 RepID=A0ABT9H2R0_9GAMM|nr:hypothetical protein [Alkalimonas collagenimarina]MDP4537600.1 hypothetical protein [Alkalimonas collagenimarina]
MRKAFIVVFIFAVSLVLIGGIFQRHALACDLLPLMNYQRLTSEVFLAADFAEPQAQIISELIESASERMSDVYGKPISKPRFVITADTQNAAHWGANETASMHRMPWRACVIIGPKGLNVDVIAHEWLHAEIQHRVGFFRFLKEVPVWFDEGAALTLDYREPFLPENIDLSDDVVTAVKELKSGKSFFSNNIRQNYQASRLAVEPLIRSDQFFNDLEKIASGESFENVFLNANASAVLKRNVLEERK